MTKPIYDPVKAHEYYMRTRQLVGRPSGRSVDAVKSVSNTRVIAKPATRNTTTQAAVKKRAQARVVRLTAKIKSLTKVLKEAEAALLAKRKAAKQNSDGKTTAKERLAAKQYRDANKSKIAADQKKAAAKSGGSSKPSAPKKISEMNEKELTDHISKIKGLISEARKQLQSANALAHSFSSSEFISHSGPTTVNTN